MNHLFTIGHNDLRLFLRNRASFVWLFLMPLLFVYFMGFANQGPGGPSDPRPEVVVENADEGFLGRVFLDVLGDHGLRAVASAPGAEAKRALRIPADFTTEVLAGRQGRVKLERPSESDPGAAALVEIRVVRALVALNAHLLEHTLRGEGTAPTPEVLAAIRARPDPVVLDARFAGRKPIPSGFGFSLPGVLVMYLMMNLLIFGASSIAAERRLGVLKRVSVHPVSRGELIAGKLYGLLLLAWVQILFLLACGVFLFGLPLADRWGGVLVILGIYAWVAASLGLWIGAVVRAQDKVVGFCVLASLVMAALGGCWWPLELVPESVRIAAHFFPTAWAMDALHQVITFGAGLEAASRATGVLALFGLAANAAAIRWFRP
ncbi:MAG: ABC transporter permease [Verrucomicrobiales bacterium]|nr:ABC transporter permease [Verrucomicrobiales bacterium]